MAGYEMTRKGRAGAALAIAAIGSFVAGTLSVVGLMLLAPPLAALALRFGPPEYTALLCLGLIVLGYLSGGSMLKTLAMAVLGLLLGMIGIDTMTGYMRFTYGVMGLGAYPVVLRLLCARTQPLRPPGALRQGGRRGRRRAGIRQQLGRLRRLRA